VSLGFVVDGRIDDAINDHEADGYDMRASVAANCRKAADRRRRDEPAHRLPVHACSLSGALRRV
jgi:hypothetical protein